MITFLLSSVFPLLWICSPESVRSFQIKNMEMTQRSSPHSIQRLSTTSGSKVVSWEARHNFALRSEESRGSTQIEDDGERDPFFNKVRALGRSVLPQRKEPGKLILLRAGDSLVRDEMTFTGWIDVDLGEEGIEQMKNAARLLRAGGYSVDVTFTSRLKRSIRSAWIILGMIDQKYQPVYKSWRLNERMYGALEGLSKPLMAKELGESVVQNWRTSLLARPPPMSPDHRHWHGNDRKYADLIEDNNIPTTESLQDTMERALPIWYQRIQPMLEQGQNVLVVAHANSIRGIVKHIDNLSAEEIQRVKIPTGIPLVYKFDHVKSGLTPKVLEGSTATDPLRGEYLGASSKLDEAFEDLYEREKQLSRAIEQNIRGGRVENSIDNLSYEELNCDITFSEKFGGTVAPAMQKGIQSVNAADLIQRKSQLLPGSLIVMCRHGKTINNNLGLFTGWEDAELSDIGRNEAKAAGQLLKAHNVEFDVMYTSWLSRAIETGWTILDELDQLWLPIIKSWRLNERMYGALTSISKSMVKQTYGEDQFVAWRRGYTVRPPPVTSFSEHYPGNDNRYVKYVTDTRFSLKESLIRSLSNGRMEFHKKFPKTESLKDCMDRTIPYFKKEILEPAISSNKSVLITTHENAIRGLLMHLCNIPEDRIAEVEIPTGLPLVYNVEKKCVQLLDDGSGLDPVERYDFGKSPELLFAPCDIAPSTGDVVDGADRCFIGSDGRTYSYDPIIRFEDESFQRSTTLKPINDIFETPEDVTSKLEEQMGIISNFNI